MDITHVDRICETHGNRADQLIGILQDVQAQYKYLPKQPLERVAALLGIPIAQVFSVATFFKAFSLEPRGKRVCQVCMGTACHVRGARGVLDEIERELDVKPGKTTKDGEFTLETVNCLGACALGPIVVIDEHYHGKISALKVADLFKKGGEKAKGASKESR
jgi:NADH:ubiquinone oxidoreductase subunit E